MESSTFLSCLLCSEWVRKCMSTEQSGQRKVLIYGRRRTEGKSITWLHLYLVMCASLHVRDRTAIYVSINHSLLPRAHYQPAPIANTFFSFCFCLHCLHTVNMKLPPKDIKIAFNSKSMQFQTFHRSPCLREHASQKVTAYHFITEMSAAGSEAAIEIKLVNNGYMEGKNPALRQWLYRWFRNQEAKITMNSQLNEWDFHWGTMQKFQPNSSALLTLLSISSDVLLLLIPLSKTHGQ